MIRLKGSGRLATCRGISDATAMTSKAIPRLWDVPGIFHRRLGQEAGRQRSMFHEGHLLLILHDVPEPGVPERTAILFWRNPEGLWRTTDSGGGKPALKELLDRYADRIDKLEAALAEAEIAKELFEILRAVNPLRRAARNLMAAMQTAREQVDHVEIITFRDQAYNLSRASELLGEDTKNAMEYDLARVAEEQTRVANDLAKSGHRLNLLAALFLPLTAIASVFGMNLPSGLENVGPWAFWVALALGTAIGLVVRSLFGGGPVPESAS